MFDDANKGGYDDRRLKCKKWQDAFYFHDLKIHFIEKINIISSVELLSSFGQIVNLKFNFSLSA